MLFTLKIPKIYVTFTEHINFQIQCDIHKNSTNIHLITSTQGTAYFKIYKYNFTLFVCSLLAANNKKNIY